MQGLSIPLPSQMDDVITAEAQQTQRRLSMSISTYIKIPKTRFALHPGQSDVAYQESAVAKPREDRSTHARWVPVVLGALALYLLLSVAQSWGPTALAVVLPLALFGLTRTIYRAAALSLD